MRYDYRDEVDWAKVIEDAYRDGSTPDGLPTPMDFHGLVVLPMIEDLRDTEPGDHAIQSPRHEGEPPARFVYAEGPGYAVMVLARWESGVIVVEDARVFLQL